VSLAIFGRRDQEFPTTSLWRERVSFGARSCVPPITRVIASSSASEGSRKVGFSNVSRPMVPKIPFCGNVEVQGESMTLNECIGLLALVGRYNFTYVGSGRLAFTPRFDGRIVSR
jgi:hypothetical protein